MHVVIYRFAALAWLLAEIAAAHDGQGHQGPTYTVSAPYRPADGQRHLLLSAVDQTTGQPLAARFTLLIDQLPYVPAAVGDHGLRFESIHQGKKQRFVATYARGTGAVAVPLPERGSKGRVTAVRGFEYASATADFSISGSTTEVTVRLRRWADPQRDGWFSADEHVHFDRTRAEHDHDWLSVLDGDGLHHAHFMVLRGGNLPGIWARQFAYGQAGEANDGARWIRPGEEFRDARQGHINLLGIEQVIEPISTGGIGRPAIPTNYPPLYEVFLQNRSWGGIGGPAHGARLSRSPTAVLDTVLGAVDFFEIANTHLVYTDVWYRLMNCGYIVPPAAGTDLPNFPFRDPWQPLLGETRMYVQLGQATHGFDHWKQAVRQGAVFVTSGPLIRFSVNGAGPGGHLQLAGEGGSVVVEGELSSPRPLNSLALIRNGQPVPIMIRKSRDEGIYRWTFRHNLQVTDSCWLALRGTGPVKSALKQYTGIEQRTMAHTAAVVVRVGDRPVGLQQDIRFLRNHLADQQQYYRAEGNYDSTAERDHFLQLFEKAIQRLDTKPLQK